MGYALLALALAGADQLIKYFSSLYLKYRGPVIIIQGFFRLSYVENNGAAFSILKGKLGFLVLVTCLSMAFLAYLLKTGVIHGRLGKYALACVVGGGMGNFIDRVRLGFVVDMFDWCWFNFPVFNFADLCITAGAILFFLMIYRDYRQEKEGERPSGS